MQARIAPALHVSLRLAVSACGGAAATAGEAGPPVAEGNRQVEGHSLVLTGADGKVQRGIALPYDDPETPVYPDRMCFGGTMYKRQ